ncbi:hypothetical protein ACKP2L_01210 [Oenococcus alcoholitolerans]|uniref:Uncharacterized protein n=1 Tax=Oenococcus alcoholitolerans TaxID=931074 RepID=A0ABR4XR69_9LACO|nr:hypothetical protein Q757_03935 [Oenococcus alcoholitolerans]
MKKVLKFNFENEEDNLKKAEYRRSMVHNKHRRFYHLDSFAGNRPDYHFWN